MIQAVLLLAVATAGALGPAWTGGARLATTVFGIALIAGGLTLAVRAGRDLGDALTPLPYPRASADLVVSGVYSRVRHPIYGGLVVGAVGWGLLTASLPAFAAAVLLLGFFEIKSRREEAWLEGRFLGYPVYRARTRRLIPWIG